MEALPWQTRAISPGKLWKEQLGCVVFGSSSLKRSDTAQLLSASELDVDLQGSCRLVVTVKVSRVWHSLAASASFFVNVPWPASVLLKMRGLWHSGHCGIGLCLRQVLRHSR